MSLENAKRFVDALIKDPELQKKFAAAREPAEVGRIAVQAGSDRGLSFTAEELQASLPSLPGGGGELNDDQLDSVAGGIANTPEVQRIMYVMIGRTPPWEPPPSKQDVYKSLTPSQQKQPS
jgi:predicted ribosomally synthesized peptide with nif11-like leader